MSKHCTNIQYWDPFQAILDAFRRLHPDARCRVVWVEGLHEGEGVWGRTHFNIDPPLVELDGFCPVAGSVDVLCHELAHVAAGLEAEHGDAWSATYDDLVAALAPPSEHPD